MQLRIALHSATLLAVGGRMVYSTCTFNPVEDEAVVAEVCLKTKSSRRSLLQVYSPSCLNSAFEQRCCPAVVMGERQQHHDHIMP